MATIRIHANGRHGLLDQFENIIKTANDAHDTENDKPIEVTEDLKAGDYLISDIKRERDYIDVEVEEAD